MSTFKKYAKKARGALIKRYFNKGYKPKFSQMSKDVKYLKSVINSEKKRFDLTTASRNIGQADGNSSGAFVADYTPIMAQGITSETRNGSSIKLHSTFFEFQLNGQEKVLSDIHFKFYLIQIKGASQTPATFLANMFNVSPFTGIIDYNSEYDPDYFGQYKILRQKKFTLKAPQITGQYQVKTIQFGHQYNKGNGHHIRFNDNGTVNSDGQLIIILLADTGNISVGTTCTLPNIPMPSTNIKTGTTWNITAKNYYYDN